MKKAIILILAAICALPALADDYGLWTSLAVQKSLNKQFSVDAGVDLRAENKLRDLTRYGFEVGLNYRPLRYLGLSAGYNFIRDYNLEEAEAKYKTDGSLRGYNVDEAFWRSKHRATFDVTGSLPIHAGHTRITLSARERYQYTHFVSTDITQYKYRTPMGEGSDLTGAYAYAGQYFSSLKSETDTKKAKDRHYLRSRFGLELSWKHCDWSPYVTYEFSNSLTEQMHLDKQRLTIGTEWKVSKQHRLDFAYVYNNGADDDDTSDSHILSIGYKFKF